MPPDMSRDYATISPSARALLLMKGYTGIPYAREAAALIMYPEAYAPDYSNRQPGFWARVLHYESRYRSIDQLLSDLKPVNILELSSGFSFRSLAATREQAIHYIDTDLPELIGTKREFVHALTKDGPAPKGWLELLSLNALDAVQFNGIVDRFATGELVIVNEGLLMYLDMQEKEQLCRIIYDVLKRRGGYWITADAYVRKDLPDPMLEQGDTLRQFFQEHQIEEKKFASFDEAATFFDRMGFVIDKEATTDYSQLDSLPYLVASSSPELLGKMQQRGRINATWRLKVKE